MSMKQVMNVSQVCNMVSCNPKEKNAGEKNLLQESINQTNLLYPTRSFGTTDECMDPILLGNDRYQWYDTKS
jgi:hypothetical protein